eukprot:TRINITY_DN4690_c0_g5_i1.p1 TRINITY_DN4690_c0_g5~~TRINITY_DN4690_c0_g5_i1.p1  ORF type:complete len:420 (-),score=94.25 TRINITY_DN4690_c0_g5_i1:424-1536(-)
MCEGEYCGLVVVCSWPMPGEVLERYAKFRQRLVEEMPPEAYVYPGSTLHCTVATLRSFLHGPLDAGARERLLPVLQAASAQSDWPRGPFRLRMRPPTLEGSAGIFHYEDVDGAVAKMRECLRVAVAAHGGCAAIGSDRSNGRPVPGGPAGDPAPHLPDIIHSTVLRWSREPPDRAAARAAFARAAATWEPAEVLVPRCCAVYERVPYMHLPAGGDHVWWSSDFAALAAPAAAEAKGRKRCLPCSEVSQADLLSVEGIAAAAASLPLWSVVRRYRGEGTRLERSFVARNFQAALRFLNEAGAVAEELSHHPDFHLTNYREVSVVVSTHKVGGLTAADVELARLLDERVKVDYSPKWLKEHPEAQATAFVAS